MIAGLGTVKKHGEQSAQKRKRSAEPQAAPPSWQEGAPATAQPQEGAQRARKKKRLTKAGEMDRGSQSEESDKPAHAGVKRSSQVRPPPLAVLVVKICGDIDWNRARNLPLQQLADQEPGQKLADLVHPGAQYIACIPQAGRNIRSFSTHTRTQYTCHSALFLRRMSVFEKIEHDED